jgi:hypothetical protein
MNVKPLLISTAAMFLLACTNNPLTQNDQFHLTPDGQPLERSESAMTVLTQCASAVYSTGVSLGSKTIYSWEEAKTEATALLLEALPTIPGAQPSKAAEWLSEFKQIQEKVAYCTNQ